MKIIKHIIWRMVNLITRILIPTYWLQNYRTCYAWDSKLRELMQNEIPKNIDGCTMQLGKYTIWIENYPYAFGSPHKLVEVLPSAITRIQLVNFINKHLYE